MNRDDKPTIDSVETELRKRELDLAALHTQINSHFFYNVLASIRGIANLGSKELLSEIIEKTVRYLKYSSAINNESDLYNEIRYLELYIDIHRILSNRAINMNINCPDDLMSASMQKFLLQPIVENIVNHSVSASQEYTCIDITVKRCADDIIMVIRDNGKGIAPARLAEIRSIIYAGFTDREKPKTAGVGMYNIQQRLRLYYGKKYRLRIFSKEGEGTSVYLPFPYKKRRMDVDSLNDRN